MATVYSYVHRNEIAILDDNAKIVISDSMMAEIRKHDFCVTAINMCKNVIDDINTSRDIDLLPSTHDRLDKIADIENRGYLGEIVQMDYAKDLSFDHLRVPEYGDISWLLKNKIVNLLRCVNAEMMDVMDTRTLYHEAGEIVSYLEREWD